MARTYISQGDIVYHKLTGQPMIALEDQEEGNSCIDCRYMANTGVFHVENFYVSEVLTSAPEPKKPKAQTTRT
jgi:hypothetical protein